MALGNTGAAYRPVSRLVLSCVALLLGLALMQALASAHAQVASSTPANGASVSAGLKQITIHFSEEISPDQSAAQIVGPSGTAVSGVTVAVDRSDRTIMNILTQPLTEGKYIVEWVAVTEEDNGHTSGRLSFSVSAGTGAGSNGTGADSAAPVSANTNIGQGWLIAGIVSVAIVLAVVLAVVIRGRTRTQA